MRHVDGFVPAVTADPRLAATAQSEDMPFDRRRRAYGGRRTPVGR